jgi:hypothetical protein
MASPTVSWCQQFVNLLVGQGEVPAKRVDATYINALATDICRAIAERMSSGDKAVDAGSGINQTIITLYSDSNRISQIKAGDWFQVTELATGSVWTGTCSVNDVISFSTLGVGVDGQLMSGAAPADYSAAAFIDDLRIEIRHQLHHEVQMQEINLTDGDVGALQTDDLLRPGGAVLETDLTTLETAFTTEHTSPAGDHLPEIISNEVLDVDCFAPDMDTYESVENLVDGDFEYDDDGDGVVRGWLPYLAPPTVDLTPPAGGSAHGARCQRVITAGAGPGINAYADYRLHYLPSDFQNKEISFSALIYATNAGSVVMEVNDGVAVTNQAVGTAGAWAWFHFSHTANAAATTAEFRIYANQATTFYVAAVDTHLGRLNWGYHNAPAGAVDRLLKPSSYENYLPNSDFKDWTALWGGAAAPPPDWWTVAAGAPVIARNAANWVVGQQYSMDVTMNLGDAIQTATINGRDMRLLGVYTREGIHYVSFFHYGVVGPPQFTVAMNDGIAAPTTANVTPTVGAWRRFLMPVYVDPLSVGQTITITCNNPGQVIFDGPMWTFGQVPTEYKPSSVLQPYVKDFVHAGAIPAFPQNMTSHGSLLDIIVPSDMYIHRLMVDCGVAPGGVAVDTYDVTQNAVAVGITVTIAGAATVGGTHVPGGFLYNQGDLLQVLMTPGGGATMDIKAVVEGYKVGT